MRSETSLFDGIQKKCINYSYPNSRKVKMKGTLHPSIKVSMREVSLESGGSILLYDSSGPFSYTSVNVDILKGIPKIRKSWIEERGSVDCFTEKEKEIKKGQKGKNVTQLYYARRGIISPEMEYIAIRENLLREELKNDPDREERLKGQPLGAQIPEVITPEFV